MNVADLHTSDKPVSVASLFKQTDVLALKFQPNALLKEHVTKVPALLVCIDGTGVYEDEHGTKTTLKPGDYILIEPHVKHWVSAPETSNFLLLR